MHKIYIGMMKIKQKNIKGRKLSGFQKEIRAISTYALTRQTLRCKKE